MGLCHSPFRPVFVVVSRIGFLRNGGKRKLAEQSHLAYVIVLEHDSISIYVLNFAFERMSSSSSANAIALIATSLSLYSIVLWLEGFLKKEIAPRNRL